MIITQSKKPVIIVTIVLLLVLLITPKIVGRSVESVTVDTLLNMIPTEAGALLDITPGDFQSGWFTSTAQIEIGYQPLEDLTGVPVSLSLNLVIKHGPLLFTNNGIRLGLAYADITPVLLGFEIEELGQDIDFSELNLDFYILARFNNSLELGFDLAEFSASLPTAALRLEGVTGMMTLASDQSSIVNLNSRQILFNNTDGSFDVDISAIAFDSSRADVGQTISPGTASFSIPQLSSSAPLPMTIDGITADYTLDYSDASQDRIDVSQLFSVNNLEWDIPFNSLQLSTEFNQVNRHIFEQYFSFIEEVQNLDLNNPGAVNSQVTAMSGEFSLLLARESFEFINQLKTHAYGGDHRLNLQVNWQGIPGLASVSDIEISEVINALDVTLTFDGDDVALSQSPLGPALEEYKNQGLLSSENGRLILNGRLTNGQLVVNDEVFPLDQLFDL